MMTGLGPGRLGSGVMAFVTRRTGDRGGWIQQPGHGGGYDVQVELEAIWKEARMDKIRAMKEKDLQHQGCGHVVTAKDTALRLAALGKKFTWAKKLAYLRRVRKNSYTDDDGLQTSVGVLFRVSKNKNAFSTI